MEVATDGLGNREFKPRPLGFNYVSYDVSLLDDHLEARGLLYSVRQMMTSIPKHPPTPKKTIHAITEERREARVSKWPGN